MKSLFPILFSIIPVPTHSQISFISLLLVLAVSYPFRDLLLTIQYQYILFSSSFFSLHRCCYVIHILYSAFIFYYLTMPWKSSHINI